MDEYNYGNLVTTTLNDDIKMLNDDLDVATEEIIRLRQRIETLEERQNRPSETFWGQLVVDIGCAVGFVWLVVQLFGR